MRQIKLLIEYDGTAYHGWQIQKNKPTIQNVIEENILRITGKKSSLIGASRTDAGVHSLGQVAAFKTQSMMEPETVKKALNSVLPYDIRILDVSEINTLFHPRHDAIKKSYFYIIANKRANSAFLHKYTWRVPLTLNLESMKKASQVLKGEHDFSAFQGSGSSVKDSVRNIFSIKIEHLRSLEFMTANLNGNFIKIRIEANSFLRHMVRNIIGTLVEIGRGRISSQEMKTILKSGNRRLAGPTAPSNGLFLERIVY